MTSCRSSTGRITSAASPQLSTQRMISNIPPARNVSSTRPPAAPAPPLGGVPLPLADIGRLVRAEAHDHRHRLLPRHAEGLGLVALWIERGIDRERVLAELDRPNPIHGERHEVPVRGHLADTIEAALHGEQPVGIGRKPARAGLARRCVLDVAAAATHDRLQQAENLGTERRVVLDAAIPPRHRAVEGRGQPAVAGRAVSLPTAAD